MIEREDVCFSVISVDVQFLMERFEEFAEQHEDPITGGAGALMAWFGLRIPGRSSRLSHDIGNAHMIFEALGPPKDVSGDDED